MPLIAALRDTAPRQPEIVTRGVRAPAALTITSGVATTPAPQCGGLQLSSGTKLAVAAGSALAAAGRVGTARHQRKSRVARRAISAGAALVSRASRREVLLLAPTAAAAAAVMALDPAEVVAAGAANLRGRTACVTGATRGIGKGISVALGEAGATVFLTGRRADALAKTAELVTRAGGEAIPVVCDHSDDAQVARAFDEISAKTGGSLDVLVNNAFQDPALLDTQTDALLSRGAKFFELPLKVWDDVHRVGLRSHYVASYYAAPLLLKSAASGFRPLLCVTSAPAAVTYYYAVAYGVAKAGSDRLVRDLQVELGPSGVDCVSVWPGVVYTETVQRLYETGDTERLNRVTGGADPKDICESPLLTGRVVASLAADTKSRAPPFVSADGLTGRICVAAEGAEAFGLRDGGPPGSVAFELFGADRRPAPSIRSLGYLAPAFLKEKLPEGLRWMAIPGDRKSVV